jgi:signal transduction histidine kinase
MIQMSVQDSGIGIKHEDKKKLFKLFGFLDVSKELNAKGVGLGLHIS